MTYSAKQFRLSAVLLLALATLLAALFGGSVQKAEAAPVNCPTFRVLHNDRIGKLKLPKGTYNMKVLNGNQLSCAQASKLFARFLQDWDGVLPKPWIIQVASKTFRKGAGSSVGFRVSKAGSGGGGGGGGGTTPRGCPSYFQVLHNDSIGSFKVPAGRYRITLVGPRKINCARAYDLFREFLLDYNGVLPKPWVLKRQTATFTRGVNARVGFNINRIYGPSPAPKPSGKVVRCTATFRVLNNDRIGKLNLPRGPYWVSVGNGLSCPAASDYFRQFLNIPSGNLPRPWRLNASKARFQRGDGGPFFRVQQAN
jgi:hypothetical protein